LVVRGDGATPATLAYSVWGRYRVWVRDKGRVVVEAKGLGVRPV
jgi:hypothetical protein